MSRQRKRFARVTERNRSISNTHGAQTLHEDWAHTRCPDPGMRYRGAGPGSWLQHISHRSSCDGSYFEAQHALFGLDAPGGR